MKKVLFSVIVVLLSACGVQATHNRAGEIRIEYLGGLTVRAIITTYSVPPPDSQADRPELEIRWGDGTLDTIPRVNGGGNGVIILPGIKKNIYISVHTYPSTSTYKISMEDPNRNAGINNIPNSVNVPFYIETEITLSAFSGASSTPILLNPPIDNACVGRRYEHNPGAYDPDGDSLSYELTACLGEGGVPIVGYTFPQGVTINATTGDLVWDVPDEQGEYNFAIKIIEWRRRSDGSYSEIGYTIRDMQVTVKTCDNNPPTVTAVDEICVEAGDTLQFLVRAWDQDGDPVILTGTGGALELNPNPATFSQPVSAPDTAQSTFQWITACGNVQLQPYTMSFRVEDNPPFGEVSLVDYHTTLITVVAPAPKNPNANPQGRTIQLSWDASICQEANSYKIYRRMEQFGFTPDTCELGVPSYTGYQQIGTTEGLNSTTFLDDDAGAGLTLGIEYCYMIVACFPDGAQSYASEEFCAELLKDLPILTNVSVRSTAISSGSMYVAWSRPTELDTIQIPGPYEYRVLRSDANNIADFQLVETYSSLNDTIFIDTLINTETLEFIYKIELYNDETGNEFVVGESDPASSVFITTIGADNQIELLWNETVPWINDAYEVYRQDENMDFVLIGTTMQQTYTDTGLANEIERCYRIKSIGRYSTDGLIDPIENWSQENCTTPVDTMPPCKLNLTVESDCVDFFNNLTWSIPEDCYDPNDYLQYQLLYTPIFGQELQIIATIDFEFSHGVLSETMAGCYAIAAIDSFQNISTSDTFCIDKCSNYELPNVFTPGADGNNDYFLPFPYAFVESVELKIYNRWGQKMFETTDPSINWDGTNAATKQNCVDGVYFYTCTVNEIRLTGIVPRNLHGFIHLLRNKEPGPN